MGITTTLNYALDFDSKKDPITENTTYIGHRAWKNQSCNEEKSSSLTIVHNTRRCYTGCWGEVISSHPSCKPCEL